MTGVKLTPDTEPVTVTVDPDGGNVTITPDSTNVEIIADAKQVCVDSDGQPTVEVTPQTQIVAVTASREPSDPVQVEVAGQTSVAVAGLVSIQGPPGAGSSVTYVTPTEFEQNSEFAYFGWPVHPNPGDGWRILRISVGTPYTRVNATVENNPSYADFPAAWADRQSLNYEPG